MTDHPRAGPSSPSWPRRTAPAAASTSTPVAGDREAASPVNGERLSCPGLAADAAAVDDAVDARPRRVPAVAHGARHPPAAPWSSGSASCSPSTRTTSPR